MSLFKNCVEISSYHTLSVKGNLKLLYRATLTKLRHIKINLIWTQINYSSPREAHLKIQRIYFSSFFVKKGKCGGIEKFCFFFPKITETAHWETPPKAKSLLFRTFNSYSFNFSGGLCNRRILAFVGSELRARGGGGGARAVRLKKKKLSRFPPFYTPKGSYLWYGVCHPSPSVSKSLCG